VKAELETESISTLLAGIYVGVTLPDAMAHAERHYAG
jgi:hypothetical protein